MRPGRETQQKKCCALPKHYKLFIRLGREWKVLCYRYLFHRIAEAFVKAVTGDDHNVDFPCHMLCRTAVDLEGLAGTQSYLGARDHRVGTWFGLTALRALSVLQSLSLYSQPRLLGV